MKFCQEGQIWGMKKNGGGGGSSIVQCDVKGARMTQGGTNAPSPRSKVTHKPTHSNRMEIQQNLPYKEGSDHCSLTLD